MSDEITFAEPSRRRRVELEAGVRIGSVHVDRADGRQRRIRARLRSDASDARAAVAIKIRTPTATGSSERAGCRRRWSSRGSSTETSCRFFDAGELDDGRQYLAMELLTGKTLRDLLNDGALSRAQTLAVLRGIASALDAVHARGLVHRDQAVEHLHVPGRRRRGLSQADRLRDRERILVVERSRAHDLGQLHRDPRVHVTRAMPRQAHHRRALRHLRARRGRLPDARGTSTVRRRRARGRARARAHAGAVDPRRPLRNCQASMRRSRASSPRVPRRGPPQRARRSS